MWLTGVVDRLEVMRVIMTLIYALFIPVGFGKGISVTGRSTDTSGFGFRPNLTDVLHARSGSQAVIFHTAMKVFDRLSTTTCGVEAGLRLFNACKYVENSTSNEAEVAQQMDKVKSLYGIRMGICETMEGGASTPPNCKSAMSLHHSNGGSGESLKVDLKICESLTPCLGSLQKEHFLWTSYSNNLQDASAICDASRVEIETQRALDVHRKLTETLFGMTSALDQHQIAAYQWLQQAESRASEIDLTHTELLQNLSHQQLVHSEGVIRRFEEMNVRAVSASDAVSRIGADADNVLASVLEQVDKFLIDVETAKENVARMYTGVSGELTQQLSSQISEVEILRAVVSEATNLMGSGLLTGLLENFQSSFNTLQTQSEQMLQTQQEQLISAYLNKNITDQVLVNQQDIRELSQRMAQDVRQTVNDMEELSTPIKAISSMLRAYETGSIRTVLLEFFVFSLVLACAGIMLMIAEYHKYGLHVMLCYFWLQLIRVLCYVFNLYGHLEKLLSFCFRHPMGKLYLAMGSICFLTVGSLVFGLRKRHEVVGCAESRNLADMERCAAYRRGLIARGGRAGLYDTTVRAGTTPPGW